MVCTPKVTMTMRELDRLKCVQAVIDRQLKLYQAADRLGLTSRQVRRLVRRYSQEGPVWLISRHRLRPTYSPRLTQLHTLSAAASLRATEMV